MELRVLVDDEERTVSGVNETTTCEAIILAIAKASAGNGKYEMIEKFRNVERLLNPKDRPLEILQKWNEHASGVVFILKRITDDDEENPYGVINRTKGRMTPMNQGTLPMYPQPSTSSVISAINVPNHGISNAQLSTSSLPPMTSANTHIQHRNRPPPPDYKTVMDQKFASLSRGPQSRSSLPAEITEENAIASMKLSHNDLLALIEKQRVMLEKQKENLSNKEMGLRTDEERELLQLRRQQENLRRILQPLREPNWSQQYQKELKKSQKLKAQIEATKEAIDKTKSDIDRCIKEEEFLKQQIQAFKAENPPFSDLTPLIHVLEESPQKSTLKISAY